MTNPISNKTISQLLKLIRRTLYNMGSNEFADFLQISKSTVMRYERGDFGKNFDNDDNFRTQKIHKIAKMLYDAIMRMKLSQVEKENKLKLLYNTIIENINSNHLDENCKIAHMFLGTGEVQNNKSKIIKTDVNEHEKDVFVDLKIRAYSSKYNTIFFNRNQDVKSHIAETDLYYECFTKIVYYNSQDFSWTTFSQFKIKNISNKKSKRIKWKFFCDFPYPVDKLDISVYTIKHRASLDIEIISSKSVTATYHGYIILKDDLNPGEYEEICVCYTEKNSTARINPLAPFNNYLVFGNHTGMDVAHLCVAVDDYNDNLCLCYIDDNADSIKMNNQPAIKEFKNFKKEYNHDYYPDIFKDKIIYQYSIDNLDKIGYEINTQS